VATDPSKDELDSLRHLVVDDARALEPYVPQWDELAIRRGRPFCTPSWMLSWWRHGREGDARLRVVLVLDGEKLVGIGPFFAQVARFGLVEMRLLAAGFSHRVGPLAEPGRERAVAQALAHALAAMRPRPASVVFEGVDLAERWPMMVADAWPSRSRPRLRTDVVMPGSVIHIGASYDAWLERRQRRFRKEARRTARRLEEAGVRSRISTEPAAIDDLMRLHHARWNPRGGSNLGAAATAVLLGASQELAPQQRLAVALLEGEQGTISAELMLRAGTTGAFWGGGFDPHWSQHAPGTQTILAALRAFADAGVQEADIGGGHADYQRRLADAAQPVAWQTVFPRGPRYPLIRLWLLPKHFYLAARRNAEHLPPHQRARLRRLVRRIRPLPGARESEREG
jgi:CelD/BcsL family acetyltransferase involved in cellulose biosynthesis